MPRACLLIACILLISAGCYSVPRSDKLRAIHSREYIKGEYDCTQKARDYTDAVKEAGLKAESVIVRSDDTLHLVAKVKNRRGKWLYIDPTWYKVHEELPDKWRKVN